MRRRTLWLGAACCFVAGDGAVLQVRGALLSSFQREFGVSEGLLGLVAPAGTIGFVVAILAAGLAAGRLEVRRTLVLGALATAGSILVVTVTPLYPLLLVAFLAQGAAAGVFRAMDRPLLSHLYPERLGRVFVLYALAWSLGAVAGPVVVSGVLRIADWRATYLLLGLWFVPIVAVLWRLEPPRGWSERELDPATLRRLLNRPAIRTTVLSMALVGGIEGTIFTWLPYYAGTFLDRDLANVALSAYLVAYVPGRVVYARLTETCAYLPLLVWTTALAVPALALALGGTSGVGTLVAVFVAGFCLSALFPLLSAYGVEAAPEYSGPVSALATAATYAGIAVVPTVVGVVAEVSGIAAAMLLPVGLAVVLLGVLLLTQYRRYRRG